MKKYIPGETKAQRKARKNAKKASKENAPVAQLDRASGYEPEGRGFESSPVRQKNTIYFL